ncbi:MAG: hypothetical protein ACFFBV_12330 [Promethearchaeota archaeon]
MGAGAEVNSNHAGCTSQYLKRDVFNCASCHDVHDGTNDAYVRPDMIYDYDVGEGSFCILCHCNKNIADLGVGGHLQSMECSFCHSMHRSPGNPSAQYQTSDSFSDQSNSSASVDVIMRVAPVNLQWADTIIDNDTNDYEDACYGCHSNSSICPTANLASKISQGLHSHRFDAPASQKITPSISGPSVISDGPGLNPDNDYGVRPGNIYCGSCHNVHGSQFPP